MRDMAGVPVPMERIFSQTVSGRPKGEVLRRLAEQHGDAAALIFVEDKLSTLEKVRGWWRRKRLPALRAGAAHNRT